MVIGPLTCKAAPDPDREQAKAACEPLESK